MPLKIKTNRLLFLSTFLFFFGLLSSSFIQKTSPKTFLLGQDFSFLTRQQVESRLSSAFSLPPDITLTYLDQNFTITPASFSASIDYSATADSLFPRPLSLKKMFASKNYNLVLAYNSDQLDEQIASISAKIQKPFVPTELQLEDGQIKTIVGHLGQAIDLDLLKQIISFRLSTLDNSPLKIPTKDIGLLPSQDQLSYSQSQANKLIGKSLIFIGDFENLSIDDTTLISWIDFFSNFNQNKITDFSQNLSQSLKRDPINAIFRFENDKVVEFRPAKEGLIVDDQKLVKILPSLVDNLIATSSSSFSTPLPVATIDPLVKTEDANNLGIRQLLGKGVSTFKHSDATRNHNIQKGSSIVNHVLVAPGDTFSFLNSLGEVSLDLGYKNAYIIRQGKTELDVGGGICQVSTTFFRAMLNSGVDILERRPHAFRVSYYEEDSPPGYDATVFIPSPDLKFKNDTPTHILIQSTIDLINKVLTYEFYGTSDGRRVEISNYRKWGWQAPPPTRYIDDPTLAPGQLVQEEHAVAGIKTAFDWTVSRDGETIHQQTFQSNYVPWAAVFRRGI